MTLERGGYGARWVCLALLAGLAASRVYANDNDKLDLFVGELRVLKDVVVDRVAVGNGKILRVNVLNNRQLLLIAEQEGSTSLHLWHKDGRENHFNVRISKADPEIRVRLEKMVHMDVKIVEFRKSALQKLGIEWQKSITGPTLATAGDLRTSTLFRGSHPNAGGSGNNPIFSNLPNAVQPFQTYFGIATEITSRINYLANDGDATVLAEPKLSCLNGGEAKFLAGGQLPIPIRGANGEVTVEFKDFGVILNIRPYADESGIIAAKLKTEVSTVDPSVTVLGVPGFLTRRTETEMNVHENETIVISGMLSAESSKDVEKIPGLGDIPVLGHLFKSTQFQNKRTELVIFVTPRIFSATSELNQTAVDRAEKRRASRLERIDERLKFGIVD